MNDEPPPIPINDYDALLLVAIGHARAHPDGGYELTDLGTRALIDVVLRQHPSGGDE